jgi:uncharacterized protein YkwD
MWHRTAAAGWILLLTSADAGAAQAADAVTPQVVQGYLMRMNTISKAGREEALKALAANPDHLQAVIAHLEGQFRKTAGAYAEGSRAAARREQARKAQEALAAHAAQKKVVGNRFVTRESMPEFLKLVELHEAYFTTLKAFMTPADASEKRLAELEGAIRDLRLRGGLPADAPADAQRPDFLTPELRKFVDEETAKYRRVRQVYLYNRDHTPFAKDYHREAARIHNDYRLIHGLMPAELEEKLLRCAEKHSQEMVDLGYFAHVSPRPENKTWDQRIRNEGYEGSPKSENLAMGGRARPEKYAVPSFIQWLWDPHHNPLVDGGVNQLAVGLVGTYASASYGAAKRLKSADLDPAPLPFSALEIDYATFKHVFGRPPDADRTPAGRRRP